MLTNADIDLLLDALDSWEKEPAQGNLLGTMLIGIISRGDPRAMEREKQEQLKTMPEKLRRREVAIVLKAKLVGMRPERTVGEKFGEQMGARP